MSGQGVDHPRAGTGIGIFQAAPHQSQTWISRPRLARLLEAAHQRSLTLIVAPAGFGKTAMLAAWSAEQNERRRGWGSSGDQRSVRWLSSDCDASRLSLALLSATGTEPGSAGDGSADGLLANLTDVVRPPDVIIVDDAHHLAPGSLNLLRNVLQHRPDTVRVVLAARHDLSLPMVELELAGQVATIRGDQLLFTDEEADRLTTVHGLVEPEDREAIMASARGWAAALVLGARAIAGAADRSAARAALVSSNQPILDYLLGEVFTTLPARTRHVLLCTGARQDVTATEAVVLSGEPDAPTLLAELAQAGLLVSAVDAADEVRWTYHPLLRELLRRHVGPGGDERALFTAAQLRAAQHFLAHGDLAEAIDLAIQAADGSRLMELLIEYAPLLITGRDHRLFGEALEALSFEVRSASAGLRALEALHKCRTGDIDAASRLAPGVLNAADMLVAADPEPNSPGLDPPPAADRVALVTDAAVLACRLARYGWYDLSEALHRGRFILGCEHVRPAVTPGQDHAASGYPPARRWPPSMVRRAYLLIELAAAEISAGEVDTSAVHLAEAAVTARALDNTALLARSLAHQSLLATVQGSCHTAAELGREALAAAAAAGVEDLPDLGRAHLAIGWAQFFELDLVAAAESAQRAETMPHAGNDPILRPLTRILRAHLATALGSLEVGRRLLADPQLEAFTGQPFVTTMLNVSRGQLALAAGDLHEAARHTTVLTGFDWLGGGRLFAGWMAEASGRADEALAAFEQLVTDDQADISPVAAGCAEVARARILLQAGDVTAAQDALRRAITWIAPQRLLHVLVGGTSAGPAFLDALRTAAAGLDSRYAAGHAYDAVVSFLRRSHSHLGPPAELAPQATGREPRQVQLTRREADVLAELALGDSYLEIGRTLYVTENTVKTHVAAIYRKLGSTRRSEALRRARTLGLL